MFKVGDWIRLKRSEYGKYTEIGHEPMQVISVEDGIGRQWIGVKCLYGDGDIASGKKVNWGSNMFEPCVAGRLAMEIYDLESMGDR